MTAEWVRGRVVSERSGSECGECDGPCVRGEDGQWRGERERKDREEEKER